MTIRHFGAMAKALRADSAHVEVPLSNACPGDILSTGEQIERLVYARSGHTRVYYRDSTGYERSRILADFTRVRRLRSPELRRATGTEGGFTLIELLIVVILLGVLAGIVVFAVGSTKSDALHSSCSARRRSVEQSAEAVRIKNQAYPSMMLEASSPANPLVVPAPGALLTAWPSSPDYSLEYVGAAGGGSYSINVYRGAVSPANLVAGCQSL